MFSIFGIGPKKTLKNLERMRGKDLYAGLDGFGRKGVDALAAATPSETGRTANSWIFVVTPGKSIQWENTNVNNGAKIAILRQYGHGTGTGGYVQGVDYINPAMRPIFKEIIAHITKQVSNG